MNPVIPQQKNLTLQETICAVNKVVNFKDFKRPNKEILCTFQGP